MGIGVIFRAIVLVLRVRLFWRQLFKPPFEIVMKSGFIVVDKDTGRDMHRVHQADPFQDAAFLDAFFDLWGDPHEFPSFLGFDPKFFSKSLHVRSLSMEWLSWIGDPNAWVSLVTLTFLEIVLGIDNVIFISILAGKLPPDQQSKARTIGLAFALITRILLLLSIKWLMELTKPLGTIFSHAFSGRDLILLAGGLFLIAKSTHEIHAKLETEGFEPTAKARGTLLGTVLQIGLLDIVFSLDSVITAVGMAKEIGVMIAAVTIALLVMLLAAGTISQFVDRHPTIKMLALAFLILIGVVLVADGVGQHIERGYIYFAMAFSTVVEMLNIKLRSSQRNR
jgi:predicted tellurium resistance membrane protein TerC